MELEYPDFGLSDCGCSGIVILGPYDPEKYTIYAWYRDLLTGGQYYYSHYCDTVDIKISEDVRMVGPRPVRFIDLPDRIRVALLASVCPD